MEPNKRYSQVVEKPFHISQAAMDISTGDNDPCQVMIVVDGKNFLVCTLQKNKTIQVPLDLYFKAGDSVSFLTNGKCNVHLTGYLDPEFEDEPSDDEEEEEEEEEEVPALVPSKNKRKLENSNEGSANKKAKQEKKGKKAAAEDSSDSEDEGDDPLQKFLDGEDIDTDENDESFKANTSAETDSDEEEEDDDDEEEEEANDDEEEEEEESSEKADTTLDSSQDGSNVDVTKLSRSQKRRLKKKLQKEKQPQVNGVDKPKKEKQAEQQKVEKKKPEAKKDAQDGEKREKKTLSGGVFIEDMKVGTGPVAKPGKVVLVYYEGRLKQNNKMFDSCQKGPGFKFKLGAKEVITGWDIGVAGMKVGGKRKIVCPPAMGYGAKGSPPVIPPNSTLVFEVELKNIK